MQMRCPSLEKRECVLVRVGTGIYSGSTEIRSKEARDLSLP
jgi:hypothetical protein